jgi:hypothetical protein
MTRGRDSIRGLNYQYRQRLLRVCAPLCALALAGCGFVIGTALLFDCGPMPMSADQCWGGWVKTLVAPSSASVKHPVIIPDRALDLEAP